MSKVIKPLQLLTTGQIKCLFDHVSFRNADLVCIKKGGIALCLHTDKHIIVVAHREKSEPRTWKSFDRVINFLKKNFSLVTEIHLNLSEKNLEPFK